MSFLPKVSIVMSAYNCSKYISTAVHSLLSQTYVDFEIIIFDDGSSDGTAQILEELAKADKRIRLFLNKVNKGFPGFISNLNKGLSIAKGKYILRMDGDDIAHKDRIKIQVEFLDNNSDIFLIGTSFNYINESNDVIGEKVFNLNDSQIKARLPEYCPVHQPTVMFRNESGILYREKALYCEDRDLWLRFATEGKKFCIIPDKLLSYRVLATSISHSRQNEQEAYIKEVNKWYLQRKENNVETYNEFKGFDEINNINGSIVVDSIKIKFLFRSDSNCLIIRSEIESFWLSNGYSVWLPSYVYYVATFENFLSKKLKHFLLTKLLS